MQLPGKPIASLQLEAKDFINLYTQLGERSENFLPKHIVDLSLNFYQWISDFTAINERTAFGVSTFLHTLC